MGDTTAENAVFQIQETNSCKKSIVWEMHFPTCNNYNQNREEEQNV